MITRAIADHVPQPVSSRSDGRRYGLLDPRTHQWHRETTGEDLLPYLDGALMEHVASTHDIEGWLEVFVWDDAHYRDVIEPLMRVHKAWYVGERKVRCVGEVRMVPR